MKRLVLCADDYGLSPGVSRGIRELVALGRLNATSVMVGGPDIAAEAARLRAIVPAGFEIGLHLTFTSGLKPLTRGLGARYPSLPVLMARCFSRTLPRAAVDAEIAAQFQAFHHAFGQMPAFIDGHQHCHLLPLIRTSLFRARAHHAPHAWLRQCTGPHGAGQGSKGKVIAALSQRLRQQAHAQGVPVNPAFSGAYALDGGQDFAALFTGFLRSMPDRALIMCHPGYVDAALKAVDPIHEPRERELAFFKSGAFVRILADHGFTL